MGTQKNRLIETVLLSTQNKYLNGWVSKYLQFSAQKFAHLDLCITIFFDFSLTVKAAPHECVIRTGQP